MLGAEVRQRGSAGGGGALLLKRIGCPPTGLPPGRPWPRARRPWRADPKAVSREPVLGHGVWLVGPRFSRRASRGAGPARAPSAPKGIFLFPAVLGSPPSPPPVPAASAASAADRRNGSCNRPRCLRASPRTRVGSRPLEATGRRADGCQAI